MAAATSILSAASEEERAHLVALYLAGAFSEQTSVALGKLAMGGDVPSPKVLTELNARGLSDAAPHSVNTPACRDAWNEYWLTDAGRRLAGDIVRGRGPARAVKLAAGVTSIGAVLAGEHGACVLVTTPGTQTLWTADQADAFAAELVSKAAAARLAAAEPGGSV